MSDMVVHGQVVDPEIDRLRKQVQEQRREIAELQNGLDDARQSSQQATRALVSLRKQFSPMYKALQMVFGDLDAANIPDEPVYPTLGGPAGSGSVVGGNPRTAAIWQSWKDKLGAGPGKIIDVLLTHGEMNATQLKIACACRMDTVYRNVSALKTAGLIDKNGNKYALKKL